MLRTPAWFPDGFLRGGTSACVARGSGVHSPSMAEPYIRIRGLTQKFGETEVLRGIDLDVHRGETLVILGASGGGKSVLLKHLPGLLRPTGGTIEVDGVEISKLRERELGPIRRQMSVMFQGGALFDSFTVAENVAFPLREDGMKDEREIAAKVAEALELVRLPGKEEMLPSELSGGMRKRVALARAVVGKPACVLYDEPHAGLDPVTAASIDRLIRDLQDSGMTNVVITHEMRSVARIADRVIFLENGRVHFEGTKDAFESSADPVLTAFREGDCGEDWS